MCPHTNTVVLRIHCPWLSRAHRWGIHRKTGFRVTLFTFVCVRQVEQCKTIGFDMQVTWKNSNMGVGVNIPSGSLCQSI